ncbi:MAG: flagellin [Lamprobacter sp.]|uniref:flagellin N-terminal helical domain-containing protein n=1 Tax=Lamprobacter sp. TaxID=3100796 RepID=UPI002B25E247|nr:flagellin [Lamprobacter sp.]MEA3642460.1 flagellin [Lamprobacter sp.]
MSVINTNITSLIAQQNLNKSQNSLTTAMERLSSGMRINSAKDDAAGQAIANRFTSQINGLNQAVRNSNDGISIAQTTEGSLNQINDNLQTIRTLTVQAANGTNSESDLQSIQDEIGQRLAEINRISAETDFNGVRVLAEGAGALRVQVGANDNQVININLTQIDVSTLNLSGFNVDGVGTANNLANTDQVLARGFVAQNDANDSYVNATFNDMASVANGGVTLALAQLEDGGTVTGSTPSLGGDTVYTYNASSDSFTFSGTTADTAGADLIAALTPSTGETNTVTIEGADGAQIAVKIDSAGTVTRADNGAALYFDSGAGNLTENNSSGHTLANISDIGVYMAADDSGNTMTIRDGTTNYVSNGDANAYDVENATISRTDLAAVMEDKGTALDWQIDVVGNATGATYAFDAGILEDAGASLYISGFDAEKIATEPTATIFQTDEGTFTDGFANQIYVDASGNLTFDAVSGATATEDPLATLDAAIKQVDALRSELGAVQNRFSDAIFNLETNALNLSDARSRIEDADYAKEVAEMTRAQILQQAGTSVLAQANQLPQNVLSLLG